MEGIPWKILHDSHLVLILFHLFISQVWKVWACRADMINVLNVAEKPSVAKEIASLLGNGNATRVIGRARSNPVWQFQTTIRCAATLDASSLYNNSNSSADLLLRNFWHKGWEMQHDDDLGTRTSDWYGFRRSVWQMEHVQSRHTFHGTYLLQGTLNHLLCPLYKPQFIPIATSYWLKSHEWK